MRDVPPGFSEWVKANEAKIGAAKSLPYFIRNNKAVVDNILNPKPVRSALDIAKERHATRTDEPVQAIKKVWFDREATLHYGSNMLRIMGGMPDVSTVAIAEAMKRGNLDTIMAEAANLKAVGKEIYALDVLDDPML